MKVKTRVKETIAEETEKLNEPDGPLSPELRRKIDAYWRAANYLSVGQIYLFDNPLLKLPLAAGDLTRMLLGHWVTTPGPHFIDVHLNRLIKQSDLLIHHVPATGTRRTRTRGTPNHAGHSLPVCPQPRPA